jgi:membrane protein
MAMKAGDIVPLAKKAVKAWIDDRAPSMGAALSYYTVFSIAPLLLIVIAIVGVVLGNDAAQTAVVAQLQALLGEQIGDVVTGMLEHVDRPGQGVIAAAVGVVALVVGATTVFAELQDDLDRIFESPDRPAPSGLWGWLRARILSLGLVLTAGFLLLVSLLVSTALAALGEWFGSFGAWQLLAKALNFALSFGLVTAIFALMYRYMPQGRTEWRDVWIGAAVTALLFNLGKVLIGLYLGRSSVTSGFGAAGSMALLLVWVYYSAQIFLLGAEFTWVYSREFGSRRGAASGAKASPGTPAVAPAATASGAPADTVPGLAGAAATVSTQPLAAARRRLPAGSALRWLGIGAILGTIASTAAWRSALSRHRVAQARRTG